MKWLNERGYQPAFMPATGLIPPDLYTYNNHRIIRVGPLKDFLYDGTEIPEIRDGELLDIELVQTTAKSLAGSVKFLADVLQTLGLTGSPKLNLSFAGSGDLTFQLVKVTYKETSTAEFPALAGKIVRDRVPKKVVEDDGLHVVYHYAYAEKLEMRRKDGKAIDGGAGVNVNSIVDVQAKASLRIENGNSLVFQAKNGFPIAFAYKAGQLRRSGGRFEFFPEQIKHFSGQHVGGGGAPEYLPKPGIVPRIKSFPIRNTK